jgi:hypothetical protein
MIRVLIEVGENAARRQVEVMAESIRGALGVAEEHHLGGDARVVFPIEPETFFVGDPLSSSLSETEPAVGPAFDLRPVAETEF